jgi:hypothetical protein
MDVSFFNSFEEMMDTLGKRMKEADACTDGYQADFHPGDFFISQTPYGFSVYGEILPCPEDCLDFFQSKSGKFYRSTKAYSQACPEGELGDVHLSTISLKISKGLFEEARKRGWP